MHSCTSLRGIPAMRFTYWSLYFSELITGENKYAVPGNDTSVYILLLLLTGLCVPMACI